MHIHDHRIFVKETINYPFSVYLPKGNNLQLLYVAAVTNDTQNQTTTKPLTHSIKPKQPHTPSKTK